MYTEDMYTELKVELTKDIKKEIVAFANTGGGKIYIGIDDDGNVVGLNNIRKDMEVLSGMIKDGISSDLTLYTKINNEKIDGKDIIVLDVLSAPNKPYCLADKGFKPSGVYLRNGNTCIPATEELIKKMIVDNQSTSFEETVSTLQDLHFEYFNKVFKDKGIDINENTKRTLNIANLDGNYTNLGLLMSDECPYSIKCSLFEGNNSLIFKDRKEFTGCVIKQVNEIVEYINKFYNKVYGNFEGLERKDVWDYPLSAIRETILNAVIHRDYNFSGSILVSLYDNHLEVTSLGGLLKGLKLEDLYYGISQTRNKNLANIFYRLNYVESFGTGIKRIMESYANYHKKPEIKFTDNVFKIILYNVNYVDNVSQEDIIIDYLKEYGEINRVKVEEILNVSTTRAKTIIKKMVDNRLIKANDTGRNTSYILNN